MMLLDSLFEFLILVSPYDGDEDREEENEDEDDDDDDYEPGWDDEYSVMDDELEGFDDDLFDCLPPTEYDDNDTFDGNW